MAFVVTPELTALADQARQAGLGNGVDFYVRGIPFTGSVGTDLVGLSFDGREYSVEHRAADRTRELLRTTDVEAARQRFLTEASTIAAQYEPRREHRAEPVLTPAKPDSRLVTVLQGTAFGFLFGFLLLPIVVLVIWFAAESGSYGSATDKSKKPWRGDWTEKISFAGGTVLGLIVLAVVLLAVLAR